MYRKYNDNVYSYQTEYTRRSVQNQHSDCNHFQLLSMMFTLPTDQGANIFISFKPLVVQSGPGSNGRLSPQAYED